MLYRWLVFIHVLGVFIFLLSHGVSAGVGFWLRKERNIERVSVLLDLSNSPGHFMGGSFLWIMVSGFVLGYQGGWLRAGWFWFSIILLFAIASAMTVLMAIPYRKVRQALGAKEPYKNRNFPKPSEKPTEKEVDKMLRRARPIESGFLGILGIAFVLYLMMFKPF